MIGYHEVIDFDNGAICGFKYLTDDKIEDDNTFWYLKSSLKSSVDVTDKYFHTKCELEVFINSFSSYHVRTLLHLFESLEAIQLQFH